MALITGDGRGIVHQNTVVGFDLSGKLAVEGGQLETDFSAFIAHEPSSGGSSAHVSSGNWKVGQDLYVGYQAPGTLKVQGGSYVEVGNNVGGGNVHIATQPSSSGSLAHVSSDGSWEILRDLFVGDQAQGALQVDTQDQVIVGGTATIANEATSGGSSVLVSSEGIWEIGQDLRVGDQAQGSLQINSDGKVRVGGNAYLGAGTPNGDGTITLVGDNEGLVTLDVVGELFVGGDNTASVGSGRLDMEGATRLQADKVVIWQQSEFDLAGMVDVSLNSVDNRGLFTGQGRIIGTLNNQGIVSPGSSSGFIDMTNSLATSFSPGGYGTTSTVPEPSTLVLFTLGFIGTTGVVFCRRRQ